MINSESMHFAQTVTNFDIVCVPHMISFTLLKNLRRSSPSFTLSCVQISLYYKSMIHNDAYAK